MSKEKLMRMCALTTRKGRLIAYRASKKAFFNREIMQKVLLSPEVLQQRSPFVLELKKSPFLVRQKSFLYFFHLWVFEECASLSTISTLKKILASYPWPACVLSQEGQLIFVNPSLSQALGSPSSTLEGSDFVDLFVHPPLPTEDFHTKIYKLKTATHYTLAVTISHMVQQDNWVIIFLFPAEVKASLQVAGEDDISLLSQVPLPAALLDENGGIRQANALFKEKISLSSFTPLTQWIYEKDRHGFAQHLRKLRKESTSASHFSLRLRQNEHKFLVFLKYLVSHDSYTPGQFFAIFTMDDAHLLRKEADPQKLQLLGQLASGIVHDFNNLLTGILGFCDLLLERHPANEPSFKDIQQIKQSALSAARLIQQLLAFSKSSPPCQSSLCLRQCLKDLFPLMHRMVGPKILLRLTEKAGTKFFVYGDPSQLEQMLLNLAINARDAMVDGGELTFHLRTVTLRQKMSVIKGLLPPKKYVVLDIKDTGTGIDPLHVENIFDPFFSTKDPGQGTGLGLSNVLQTMAQFQGGITLETHPGQGTTFSLYFPEHKGEEVLSSPKASIAIPSPKPSSLQIRILLVEDEDPVRLFAARALREKGHEVVEARDGAQALKFAQNHPNIHIIVTDVMMPGIDGPSLACSVKAMNPGIKILFVSGYPEEQVRSHLAPSIQDVYFLPKPFALAELVNKIQDLFGG